MPLKVVADIGFGDHSGPLLVQEAGLAFEVDAIGGQKTGWFFDQRDNRLSLGGLSRRARVLDVFSYVGSFGVQAAAFGAAEVLAVDGSRPRPRGAGIAGTSPACAGRERTAGTACRRRRARRW